jgi:hypothetical protein
MKTVNVGGGEPTVTELVEQAQAEPILLRSAQGRTFVLAEIDEDDAEAMSLAHSGKFQEIVERSRRRAAAEGWLTTEQIRKQLHLE